jgi:DNA modification methylase
MENSLQDEKNNSKNLRTHRELDPRNQLNDLSSKEWIRETISVWTQKGLGANHPDAQIEKQHPAPFSFTDIRRLIRFFTKYGHSVLDPFVGIGSTLKACSLEGRNGIGFELSSKYANLAKKRLETEINDLFSKSSKQEIRQGDARELVKELEENSIDFVVTSPPYWSILHKEDHKVRQQRRSKNLDTKYSEDELDLGNIDIYTDFLEELALILGACGKVLKPKKYMAVIVSDFRDKSEYIMFHSHLADILAKYYLELRGLTILFQKHKSIFPYGYPYAYVPNIHHQYILILQNMKNDKDKK